MEKNKLDITSTLGEKGIDAVKGFLEKLLGSTVEEAGLIFADNMKLRRFKNQLRIFEKAQKIVADRGINVKTISLKALVPLVEFCSLEEEDTLQEKWANLIASFVDTAKNYESSVFPYILSQLSTKEVLEVDRIYSNGKTSAMAIHASGVDAANLVRLGLIERYIPNKMYFYAEGQSPRKTFTMTNLGEAFVECCASR